jgi:hypothetical protein
MSEVVLISAGSKFHSLAPATEKARSPNLSLVVGTARSVDDEDLRDEREGIDDNGMKSSRR